MRSKTKDPVKVTLSLHRPVKELGQSLAKQKNKSLTALVESLILSEARSSSHPELATTSPKLLGEVPGVRDRGSGDSITVSTDGLAASYLKDLACFKASESSFYPCSKPFKKGQYLLVVSIDPRPGDVVIVSKGKLQTVAEVTPSGSLEPIFREGSVDEYSASYVVLRVDEGP